MNESTEIVEDHSVLHVEALALANKFVSAGTGAMWSRHFLYADDIPDMEKLPGVAAIMVSVGRLNEEQLARENEEQTAKDFQIAQMLNDYINGLSWQAATPATRSIVASNIRSFYYWLMRQGNREHPLLVPFK